MSIQGTRAIVNMITVTNAEIRNSSIQIKNIFLEFGRQGLYTIEGPNGCGKTTLLEKLIFGDISETDNPAEEELLHGNRFRLFSYCPQKIMPVRISVRDYIKKGNPSISDEMIKQVLRRLGLEETELQMRFDRLSGGEQMKAAVACCLLKPSNYLFFDEPSNYLDDQSTETIRQVLLEEAQSRCVILVTHDSRLKFSNETTRYLFDGEGIRAVKDEKTLSHEAEKSLVIKEKNHSEDGVGVGPGNGWWFRLFARNYALLTLLLFAVVFTVLLLWKTEANLEASVGEVTFRPGFIYSFYSSEEDEWIKKYDKLERISVEAERSVSAADIPQIAEQTGVLNMWMECASWWNRFWLMEEVEHGGETEKAESEFAYRPQQELFVLAIPDEVAGNVANMCYSQLTLRAGRQPKDNAGEIAVSVNMLKNCMGYTEETMEEVIGREIEVQLPGEFDVRRMRVVGITGCTAEMISYEEGMQYGFYLFRKDDYNEYVISEKERLKTSILQYTENEAKKEIVRHIFMQVSPDKEKKIVDYLHAHYPGHSHYSRSVEIVMREKKIVECGIQESVYNAFVAVLMGGILLGLCRGVFGYNVGVLWDAGNYYIDKRRMLHGYERVLKTTVTAIFCLIEIIAATVSRYVLWTSVTVLLAWGGCITAVWVSFLLGRRKAGKQYGIEL
ncbi:MAG: ATP-binding cassette domain-containing protein [Lachnospiraceae bacterium]|nr:ATP-binding cassette domain-containing protein [Lachnospiraceae bacterium]